MVQETTAPVESAPADTAAPPSSPPLGEIVQPSEETPELPQEGGEDTAADTPADEPDDWEAFRAKHFDAEDSPYKANFDQFLSEKADEQFQRAVDWLKPQYEQLAEADKRVQEGNSLYKTANEGFRLLMGRIQKAADEIGLDEDGLTRVLGSNPVAWDALNKMADTALQTKYEEGQRQGAAMQAVQDIQAAIENGSKLAGKPSLISKFAPDLAAARRGEKQLGEVWNAWLTAAFQAKYEAGLASRDKAATESSKVEARAGQKPPQGVGATAGASPDHQKRLDRLALGRDSDGNTATAEDRAWLAAQE